MQIQDISRIDVIQVNSSKGMVQVYSSKGMIRVFKEWIL
jgi:hypothetical protein